MVDATALERELFEVGKRLAGALPTTRNPLKAIDDKAMDLASSDAELKAALFRFVDVVPACRSLDDLARHLTGFLGEVETGGRASHPIGVAMRMGNSKAGRRALGIAAAAGVKHMAQRFIVGEDPKAALGDLRGLWKDGVASSVDLLGEATVTQAEAQRYADRCVDALDTIAGAARGWPERPQLERDTAGRLARANLSVKVSALTPLLRPDAPERGKRDAADRLRPLLRRAHEVGAHLHIDMESMDSRDAVLELILELLGEEEFRAGPSAGLVLQGYLRDSPQTLDTILEWLRGPGAKRATPLTIRLVKGAYWDHELVQAAQHGWTNPVFDVKADTDANFELLTRRLLDARVGGDPVRVAIASHNLRSVAHAIAYNRLAGGADADLELQVLRGLGDPLQAAIAAQGLRVRTYCPVGDLVAGMAYLVRRLLENTSNESFLYEQARGVPLEVLLAPPGGTTQRVIASGDAAGTSPAGAGGDPSRRGVSR
jgi:RHH-type proline utilization regulon transcriptional repressor/proline dehydrogenase/delta 1-pyrroline-5-carboxylate dehydrogenase